MTETNPATEPHEETREVIKLRPDLTGAEASVKAGEAMFVMIVEADGKPRSKWIADAQHIWRELDAILRGEF